MHCLSRGGPDARRYERRSRLDPDDPHLRRASRCLSKNVAARAYQLGKWPRSQAALGPIGRSARIAVMSAFSSSESAPTVIGGHDERGSVEEESPIFPGCFFAGFAAD